MAGVATADLLQLGEGEILAGSAKWEEAPQGLINVVQFAYDWNIAGAGEQFGTRQTYVHEGSADRYGRRPPLVIQSRGLRSSQVVLVPFFVGAHRVAATAG